MVREVAIQDPLKPRTHPQHRFVPPLVELDADRGQRRSHALVGRQWHDLELPVLVGPTTVTESREVERSGLPSPRLRRRILPPSGRCKRPLFLLFSFLLPCDPGASNREDRRLLVCI